MAYSTSYEADVDVSLQKLGQTDAFLIPGQLETAFVLHSQHFMDLQDYVNAGIRLPDSSQRFQVLHPKDIIHKKFASLNKWNLYDSIKDVSISISQNCQNFQLTTLGRIVDVGGSISYFAQDAHDSISDMIPILQELCGSQFDLTNPDVEDNLECAIEYLNSLMESCEDHKNKCEAVQQGIISFKNQTVKNKHDLDAVMQDLREVEPELFAETEKKVKELNNQRLQLRAACNEVVDRSTSVKNSKTMGCVTYGITLAVYISNKVKLSGLVKQLHALEEDFQTTNKDMARLYHIQTELSQITERLGPVEQKITQAIEAMDKISSAFSEMKTGLEDLMKKLDPKNVKHKKPGMRKIAVTRLERTLPTWKTVQEAAKQFQQTGLIKYITVSQAQAA